MTVKNFFSILGSSKTRFLILFRIKPERRWDLDNEAFVEDGLAHKAEVCVMELSPEQVLSPQVLN